MDHEKGQKFAGNDSVYMGAIFMSNRKTKLECLQRHLFGLPASQAGFLKKVKAGMLLFLFEHEERKLYGVFEATSDGALNIMPNAFISSGYSFPAQILFKRIWMCKPLYEDEFRDAIKENYYTTHKFHFGLSYEQVYSLIHLFSLKKISLERNQKRGMPNKIIQSYEKFGSGKVRVPYKGRVKKFHSDVNSTDNDIDSSRHPGCFPRDIGQSMYDKGYKLTSGNSIVDTKTLPNLMHSTFQDKWVRRDSSPFGPNRGLWDYQMTQPSLAQEHTAFTGSHVEPKDPLFRSQLHPSQSDCNSLNLPSSNYQSPEASWSHGIYEGSSLLCTVPSHASVPFRASESHATDLHDYKEMSFLDRHNPRPAPPLLTSGMITDKGTTSSPSMHSPCIPFSHKDDLIGNRESLLLPKCLLKDELDVQYCCNSEFQEENQEPKPNLTMHDEYYPMPISEYSKLHSDTDQHRTSAFSRLSRFPEPHQQYEAAWEQETSPSLHQLLEGVSEGRGQWCKNTGVGQVASTIKTEQSEAVALWQPNNEMITEERSELPFLNFKRRMVQKMEHRTEKNGCVASSDDKSNYKRRRLVRPSFIKEECGLRHPSSQEIAEFEKCVGKSSENVPPETKTIENVLPGHKSSPDAISVDNTRCSKRAQNVPPETKTADSVAISVDDTRGTKHAQNVPPKTKIAENVSPGHKSSSIAISVDDSGGSKLAQNEPPITKTAENVSIGHESSSGAISVDNSRGPKSCRNVSDVIPRWCHLKAIAAQAKLSGGNHKGKEQSTNNAPSQATSSCEASLLPVHSECRDHLVSVVDKNDMKLVDFLPLELGKD